MGALSFLRPEALDFLLDARGIYGDIYRVDLGLATLVCLSHPRHAQHVLRDNATNYRKGGPIWDSVRTMLGNSLPVSEGDFWRRQRRMMQPYFHRQRLADLTETMSTTIDEGMAGWDVAASSETPLDLAPEFDSITANVFVRAMFGTGIDRHTTEVFNAAMEYALDYVLQAIILRRAPPWLPMPGKRRYEKALRTMKEIVFRMISQRRCEGDGERSDLLSMLVDMEDVETGERMTDQQIHDETTTMFLAGYETTSVSLAWAAHLLAQNAESARDMQAELDRVLAGREPRFADLPELKITLAVFQEALRLYAPVYWLPRQAIADDEIDGWRIPAGTTVVPLVHVMHRHPEIWDHPLRFDPARFFPERSTGRPPLAWLPFGAGQRLCLGREFALMEGQLVLAKLMQRYDLVAVPGHVTRSHVSGMLRMQGGLRVRLKKRPSPQPPSPPC
jgi:cytochrome P450